MRKFILAIGVSILCSLCMLDTYAGNNHSYPLELSNSNVITNLSRKDALERFGLPKAMGGNIWYYDEPSDFFVKFDVPPGVMNVFLVPYRYIVNIGFPFEIKAFLFYEDFRIEELPSNIEWHIDDKSIVIKEGGFFLPLREGHTNIFAICNNMISNPCGVYVKSPNAPLNTGKELVSIRIFPIQPAVAPGTKLQFLALGVFYDYSKRKASIEDISEEVSWFVVEGKREREIGGKYIYFDENGPDKIFCKYDSIRSNVEKVTKVKDKMLIRHSIKFIHLVPSVFFSEEGETVPFKAIATYYDNNVEDVTYSMDWEVSDENIAEFIQKGVLKLKKEGIVEIKGRLDSIESFSAKVVVTKKISHKKKISGFSYKFLYEDGKRYYKKDYTPGRYRTKVSVKEGEVIVAPYDEKGIKKKEIRILKSGETTVQEAEYKIIDTKGIIEEILSRREKSKLKYIIIEPLHKKIAVGEDIYFKATAVYEDGHKSDITLFGEWRCSDVNKANVDEGIVTGLGEGEVYIWVIFDNKESNKAKLEIEPARLVSISLDKYNVVAPWKKVFYIRTEGHYTNGTVRDITSLVKWHIDGGKIVDLIKPGMFRGMQRGKAKIYCEYNNIKSLPAAVTIFIPLWEIILFLLFSIFSVLCISISIFYIITVSRARRLRSLCISDSRRFVIELYEYMRKALSVFGFHYKQSYTPLVLANKINERFSLDDKRVFHYISSIFSKAVYSRHEISKEEAFRFLESYNEGIKMIKDKVPCAFLRVLMALLYRLPLHI